MHKKLAVVAPETDLVKVTELMLNNKIGCVPVVEDKKLVGIITESDFVAITQRLLIGAENMR